MEEKQPLNFKLIYATAAASFIITMAFIYFGLAYMRKIEAEKKINNIEMKQSK